MEGILHLKPILATIFLLEHLSTRIGVLQVPYSTKWTNGTPLGGSTSKTRWCTTCWYGPAPMDVLGPYPYHTIHKANVNHHSWCFLLSPGRNKPTINHRHYLSININSQIYVGYIMINPKLDLAILVDLHSDLIRSGIVGSIIKVPYWWSELLDEIYYL